MPNALLVEWSTKANRVGMTCDSILIDCCDLAPHTAEIQALWHVAKSSFLVFELDKQPFFQPITHAQDASVLVGVRPIVARLHPLNKGAGSPVLFKCYPWMAVS